jgi:hypothetical protein
VEGSGLGLISGGISALSWRDRGKLVEFFGVGDETGTYGIEVRSHNG